MYVSCEYALYVHKITDPIVEYSKYDPWFISNTSKYLIVNDYFKQVYQGTSKESTTPPPRLPTRWHRSDSIEISTHGRDTVQDEDRQPTAEVASHPTQDTPVVGTSLFTENMNMNTKEVSGSGNENTSVGADKKPTVDASSTNRWSFRYFRKSAYCWYLGWSLLVNNSDFVTLGHEKNLCTTKHENNQKNIISMNVYTHIVFFSL